MRINDDPFNLNRFLVAQERNYETALGEIQAARKREHWIWYIFPQIEGLGFSPNSRTYSIKSLKEAKAYAEHPVLGKRLATCMEAMLRHTGLTADAILGDIDAIKLRSCATLFSMEMGEGSLPHRVLERFYEGVPDPETIGKLNLKRND